MKENPKVVCIGSAIVDIEVLSTEETKEPKKGEISYFPAEIKQRAGGVARNHAEALARLGIDVYLISAFGVDLNGDPDIGATFLFKKLEGLENLDFSHSLFTKECNTATSVSIESKKGLQQGFINVEVLLNEIDCKFIDDKVNLIALADYVVIDANFPPRAMERVLYLANRSETKIWLDPTDALKVSNIYEALGEWPLENVDVFSPNFNELRAFSVCFSQKIEGTEALECRQFVSQVEEKLTNKNNFLLEWLSTIKLPRALQPRKYLIITFDLYGVLIFYRLKNDEFLGEFLAAPDLSKEILSSSGAGDW
uniref:Carbohydrate kinase PfkB domain-containing protein n=1 Tax=Meloidogyne javanica TaxID=6303 RepID=A0A915MXI0_MELJA